MSTPSYAQIAVAVPLDGPFTYQIPPHLTALLQIGHAVLVPFGPRKVSGFVVGLSDIVDPEIKRLKSISDLLTLEPLFREGQLPFFEWIARYYKHPLGEVLRTAMPSGIQRKSQKRVVLTDVGRAAATDSTLSEANQKLLSRLSRAGSKGLTLGSVLKAPLGETAPTTRELRSAEQKQWVCLTHTISEARASIRHDIRFKLTDPTLDQETILAKAFKRPGAVQQAIVSSLITRQDAASHELRADLKAQGLNTARIPAILRTLEDKQVIKRHQSERFSQDGKGMVFEKTRPTLTDEQKSAVSAIGEALHSEKYQPFLLQGVTGSGKTEVYLQVAEQCLAQGRDVIILVPEISLTPQLLGRFQGRFGHNIACLHSELTDQERFDAWRRIYRGEVPLAIGARSAIFAPFQKLGLIVVDEEHDGSFKQDDGLRYNGRDLATLRARQVEGVLVLGSATPALETRHNAQRGAFKRQELSKRVSSRPLPTVIPVDMRLKENQQKTQDEEDGPNLAPVLMAGLKETFKRGEQAILLLNRRGFAPFVLCPRCGGSFRCTSCDVSLTYHRRRKLLMCHHCGAAQKVPEDCPQCAYPNLILSGAGTERLEDRLETLFPDIGIARLDRDSTRNKDTFLKVLEAFRRRELQLLVGTQMVAKGHDFPGVTLVGILQADYLLNMPDFRASERTFQLVTQVSGRAGRGDLPGKVFVQSHNPEHYSLAFAAEHNYEGFYEHEVRLRKLHGHPPYSRIALLHISCEHESSGARAAESVADSLRQLRTKKDYGFEAIRILGPVPSPLARLNGWYRYQVLVKGDTAQVLQRFLHYGTRLPGLTKLARGVRVGWDIDPAHLL